MQRDHGDLAVALHRPRQLRALEIAEQPLGPVELPHEQRAQAEALLERLRQGVQAGPTGPEAADFELLEAAGQLLAPHRHDVAHELELGAREPAAPSARMRRSVSSSTRATSRAGSMSARRRRAGSERPASASEPSSSGTSASNVCGITRVTAPSDRPRVSTRRKRRSSIWTRKRHITPRRRRLQSGASKYVSRWNDCSTGPAMRSPSGGGSRTNRLRTSRVGTSALHSATSAIVSSVPTL